MPHFIKNCSYDSMDPTQMLPSSMELGNRIDMSKNVLISMREQYYTKGECMWQSRMSQFIGSLFVSTLRFYTIFLYPRQNSALKEKLFILPRTFQMQ